MQTHKPRASSQPGVRLASWLRSAALLGPTALGSLVRLGFRWVQRWWLRLVTAGAALALLVVLLSHLVEREGRGRIHALADAPPREVAVVFGAGVHADGTLAAALEDRVVTAIALYRAGKVRKLLMSGDNSIVGYDEPTAMKRYAIAQGVPAADIALDYAGFHTYDTCYRARAIFGVTSAVLVTQRYHLARAIFTCKGLGVDAVGVPADRQRYHRYAWYVTREQVSRARAYVQVRLLKPRPKFLGKQEPIL